MKNKADRVTDVLSIAIILAVGWLGGNIAIDDYTGMEGSLSS